MKFNSPLPQPLPKECVKAAKIFKSFVDRGNNGLDGVIPRQVLEHAKGFAIFTVAKAGFLFSARAGSGVVIARLEDGTWSAPSAIGSAGLGVGGQAGAEVTDFLVVLNSRAAVRSFMSAGSLTLGGNMSIALGPLGRNGEALGSVNTSGKVAAMYSYSKTRGLFGGVSIEGSVVVERQDANALAYRSNVTAKQLLSGSIDPPDWAQPLIKTLETCIGMPGGHKWVDDSVDSNSLTSPVSRGSGYVFGEGVSSPGSEIPPSLRKKKGSLSSAFPPAHWGAGKDGGSYSHPSGEGMSDSTSNSSWSSEKRPGPSLGGKFVEDGSATASFPTHFDSDYAAPIPASIERSYSPRSQRNLSSPPSQTPYTPKSASPFSDLINMNDAPVDGTFYDRNINTIPHIGSTSKHGAFIRQHQRSASNPFASDTVDSLSINGDDDMHDFSARKSYTTPKPGLQSPMNPRDGISRAIALFDFNPVESGDLGFKKGEVITITRKTDKTDDWWTGRINGGPEGLFPANFVEIV